MNRKMTAARKREYRLAARGALMEEALMEEALMERLLKYLGCEVASRGPGASVVVRIPRWGDVRWPDCESVCFGGSSLAAVLCGSVRRYYTDPYAPRTEDMERGAREEWDGCLSAVCSRAEAVLAVSSAEELDLVLSTRGL